MTTLFVYTSAFSSSICFGVASVLEQLGAKRVSSLNTVNPAKYIPLLKQLPYSLGLLLDILGFALFLIAAHQLPLFFVQAVGTASIAVTALVSRYFMNVRLSLKQYQIMAVLLVGLILLFYAAAPSVAKSVNTIFGYSLLGFAIAVAAGTLIFNERFNRRPTLTAFLSGLCFSGVAIASRILPHNLNLLVMIMDPVILALILFGVLGLLLFTMALQNSEVTSVYAVTFATEIVIPAIIGLRFLGDTLQRGMWLVVIGLLIVIASTTALALVKDNGNDT
jgi:drug/metabolite transporter (DMT)-like permease